MTTPQADQLPPIGPPRPPEQLPPLGRPGRWSTPASFERPTVFDPQPGTPANDLQLRLLGGPRRWRRREVARAVGVSLLSARKLWRALGFANVTDDDRRLHRRGRRRRSAGSSAWCGRGSSTSRPRSLLARALGQTTDRLVSWHTEALMEHLAGDRGRSTDLADRPSGTRGDVYPDGAAARLLLAASARRGGGPDRRDPGRRGHVSSGVLTVGFADLVSYTRLSQTPAATRARHPGAALRGPRQRRRDRRVTGE